ncbi:uncharacterized protein LOC133457731 isoform X2 [Cololabis saira]|uniref:uncharacterized protein LOC133457731 isoform X2 n=1 Tax=Cololabis saira TaxID=129043 RepID=UPI002AD29714|nr:uncharacterized protein LOC133457731 isoform X2 [Cololabis saira]
MEATLKCAALLLLTVAGAVMAGSHHTIKLAFTDSSSTRTQEKVSSGSSLTFSCCLSNNNFQRYRMYWYFIPHGSNETKLMNDTMNGNTIQQPEETSAGECSDKTYTLSNVNETHSGWYYCSVKAEIPELQTNTSNSTEVIVSSPTSWSLWDWTAWVWIVVGVSSLVLLVLIITLVVYVVKKRSLFGSKGADPIYMNSHHQRKQRLPQAELQVDTLKAGLGPQHPRTPSPSGRYDGGNQRYHV